MHATTILSIALAGLSFASAFTIPEDTPGGVYSVSYDDSGNAIHTQLNGTTPDMKMPRRGLGASKPLNKRQQVGDATCTGTHLNPGDTDAANEALDKQCDGHIKATSDAPHVYSISGGTVAFFCYIGSGSGWFGSGGSYACDSGTRSKNDAEISLKCGQYVSGLAEYYPGNTDGWAYGYDHTGANFCS